MVSTVALQEGPGFESSQLDSLCSEFACSPCVCVGLLQVLWFPPTPKGHASRLVVPAVAPDQGSDLRTVGPPRRALWLPTTPK